MPRSVTSDLLLAASCELCAPAAASRVWRATHEGRPGFALVVFATRRVTVFDSRRLAVVSGVVLPLANERGLDSRGRSTLTWSSVVSQAATGDGEERMLSAGRVAPSSSPSPQPPASLRIDSSLSMDDVVAAEGSGGRFVVIGAEARRIFQFKDSNQTLDRWRKDSEWQIAP